MPIYDYDCKLCGTFSELRKMSEAKAPALCTSCGEMAPRIISAPHLSLVDRSTRVANERNEKAAHEPRVTRRSSCGCSGAHSCQSATKQKASSTSNSMNKGNGLSMQTKKTARPWMLGH